MDTTTEQKKSKLSIDPSVTKLAITLFPNGVKGVWRHIRYEYSLGELFNEHIITESKASVPVFIPGAIKAGGHRCTDDVEFLTALVLDYDGLSEDELKKITEYLKEISLNVFSTHRHQLVSGVLRVRIVIVLSRNVTAQEYNTQQQKFPD